MSQQRFLCVPLVKNSCSYISCEVEFVSVSLHLLECKSLFADFISLTRDITLVSGRCEWFDEWERLENCPKIGKGVLKHKYTDLSLKSKKWSLYLKTYFKGKHFFCLYLYGQSDAEFNLWFYPLPRPRSFRRLNGKVNNTKFNLKNNTGFELEEIVMRV